MSTDADKAQEKQQVEAFEATSKAALLVRQALLGALPVSPEQYLTVAIPGTLIDTTDIEQGGSYVYNAVTNPFMPTAVRQAEAKLVDGMMPLASLMIGNTGKSVARSYAAALDYLVAKKATVSTNRQIRSPGNKAYDEAMAYLTKKDDHSGKTPVETYMDKQNAWAEAQDAWDTAKIQAKNDATKEHPGDNTAAVQQYNDWAQSHYRRYKDQVQGRWMDWVANGKKYDVEYAFGLVDVDSIMGRIENSKQSMRNSTIVDADGANEIQEVNLTPKNWATLCKQKVDGFTAKKPYSIDQLVTELNRLKRFRIALQALQEELQKAPPAYPVANPGEEPQLEGANTALTNAYKTLYDAQGQLNSLIASNAEPGAIDGARTAVDNARKALTDAVAAWEDVSEKHVKWQLSQPGSVDLTKLVADVNDQIGKLEELARGKASEGIVPIVDAHSAGGDPQKTSGNDMAPPAAELASPLFGVAPPPGSDAADGRGSSDPWTKIKLSFSATDLKTRSDQSSWGFSASAHVGFGFFSAGGSYSHDESTSDFRSDMSGCDLSVSFSALVVNIDRPWLYAELFNDYEIDIAEDAKLSPGPERIHALIAAQRSDPTAVTSLALYNVLPAFPTSFIVACDTVLEFTGKTEHIESHFHSVSNSGSVSVGWGPFNASASFHQQSSTTQFQMETTATGVKITFGAPQIIAWTSQILPALPRDENFQPLLQTQVKKAS